MVRQSDIETLCESMGIARPRAVAALTKYKGIDDAAQACFDGQFDHIPEDDDDPEDHDQLDMDDDAGGSCAAGSSGQAGSDVEFDEFEEDDGAGFDMDDSQGIVPAADNDPYRGLDMSKGRIVPGVEVPDAPGQQLHLPPLDSASQPILACAVTQSDFMKGCPLGSEASHLFAIVDRATSTHISCPTCKSSIPRTEAEQMLVICSDATTYVHHARRAATSQCTECGEAICTICGEASKATFLDGKARATYGISVAQDPLFHCGEVQAVVVGVGLMHVERLFSGSGGNDSPPQGGRSAKRTKKNGNGAPASDAAGPSPSTAAATQPKTTPAATTAATATAAMAVYDDDDDEDDYYSLYPHKSGKASAAGTGYAGSAAEDTSWIAATAARQAKHDTEVRTALELLRHHLPQVGLRNESVALDYMPHMATVALLRRRMLPIAAELLRCESLHDMAQPGRAEVYLELLEWMRVFSSSDALGALLAQPIMLEQSHEWKTTPSGNKERHVMYEAKAGPRELAESICVQAKTLLKGVAKIEESLRKAAEESKPATPEPSPQKKQGLTPAEAAAARDLEATLNIKRFCISFIEQIDKIDSTLVKTKGQGFVDKVLSAVRGEVGREKLVMAPQFAEVDMQQPSPTATEAAGTGDPSSSDDARYRHAHNDKIRSTQTSNSKRGLQIAKELATLRVSLPTDTVFLRVDEARQDVLKVLIIGPEDSPYAMGCFAFDMFLPAEYNQSPPLVKIMTTSGGRVRFNPNLYAEGKVCLSLLGTWSGPGWQPGRSTILQVLLSIQSLILGVSEPCLNEPGWSSYGGTSQSKKYSLNCRRQTVQVAMLENLRDPPFPWEDVIKAHFRCNKDAVLKQLDVWEAEDDGKIMHNDGTSVMHNYSGGTVAAAAATAPANASADTAGNGNQQSTNSVTADAQPAEKPETPMQKLISELRKKLAEL